MANKTKNVLGGAMSGAAAGTAAMPGWGTAIGAVAGGLMGAFMGGEDKEKAKMLDQQLIDRLANQALGNEATASELNMRQAFDRTLAQQIAAARTQSRGVNPALQSRNIARMASEKASEAAAESAKLSVQERANSFNKYMQAIDYNNNILKQNNAQDAEQEKQGNLALANGLNAAASAAGNYALKSDAANQLKQQQPVSKNTSDVNTSGVLGSTQVAQSQNAAYGMGADQSALGSSVNLGNQSQQFGQYTQPVMPTYSDERVKTKIKPVSDKNNSMIVTSDERQKDLIKSEDLPANNNLGMQNLQAAQPAAPVAPAAPTNAPQAATAAAPAAKAAAPQAQNNSGLLITPDMISKAQTSMRAGGNVSDIQNLNTQLSMPKALTPEQDAQYRADAQREAARQDTWDNRAMGRNKDENELYASYINRFNQSNAEQMAAYNRDKEQIDAANTASGLERSARLANFYTGMSTITPQDIAQGQVAKNNIKAQADAKDAEAKRQADIMAQLQSMGFFNGQSSSSGITLSDERVKTGIKSEKNTGVSKANDMSPESFLSKLHAYSYEYKDAVKNDPRASTKPQLGILAQDLEKAGPVGKQMVQEDPNTGVKQVDFSKGFGAILASQVTLNQRLQEIEKKFGKKKEQV